MNIFHPHAQVLRYIFLITVLIVLIVLFFVITLITLLMNLYLFKKYVSNSPLLLNVKTFQIFNLKIYSQNVHCLRTICVESCLILGDP